MQLKKYPKKLTTLFISTILLLASTPVVSASEEPSSEDEMSQVEEHETLIDENEAEPEAMMISIIEEDIISENIAEPVAEEVSGEGGDLDSPGNSDTPDNGEPEPEDPEPEDPEPEEPIEPEPDSDPDPEPELDPELEPVEPDPEQEPEGPINPEPEDSVPPVVSEPIPDTSIEPILEPNPIEPNASTISGIANPGSHVIVMYPGTDRQRAATVNSDGSWLIRNVGGDQAYLTEGSSVPMNLLIMDNGQEYTYSYAFEVGDPTATDLIEESQTVYVPNNTETASTQNNPSSTTESTYTQVEDQELLPPTGEEDNLSVLAFASIASGMSLIFIDKIKKYA